MYPTIGYTDKPGTLTLRTTLPMEYSRAVMSNKWYLKREAEPKDNELWTGNKPNLHQATYKMIGKNIPSDKISSETESHTTQKEVFRLIQDAKGEDPKRDMVDMTNKDLVISRLAKEVYDAYGSLVMSRHTAPHEKRHLETTYIKDYVNHNPHLIGAPKSQEKLKKEFELSEVDNSFAFRKMQSQFTDLDSPKRTGINTFHVQHGEYPNQVIKNQINFRIQNNIFGN